MTVTNVNATVKPASTDRQRFLNMSYTPCYSKGVGLTTGSAGPKVTVWGPSLHTLPISWPCAAVAKHSNR